MASQGPLRVSVLIPVRNAEATLATCLRSVARQSEGRFECIVVDDGSSDDSAALVRAFAHRDPRFRLTTTPPRGLVDALNTGLRACRAPFVARMDADDWMHRTRLERQLDALERDSGLTGVGSHVRLFPRSALSDGLRAYEAWLTSVRSASDVRSEAFVECPLAHPTLMLRREVFGDFGYRDHGWPEDYDLVLRLLGAGHQLGVVPQRLLAWRDSSSRLSRTHPRYARERFTACKAHHLCETFLARTERYVLWGYGGTGRALRRALSELGRTPSHIVELHPRRLGQTIHGAPVIPPEGLRELRDLPIIASVAGSAPRAQIRAELERMRFEETRDFVCAA